MAFIPGTGIILDKEGEVLAITCNGAKPERGKLEAILKDNLLTVQHVKGAALVEEDEELWFKCPCCEALLKIKPLEGK